MDKIRAGLVGISGYTGMELARLLVNHPAMKLVMACSRTEAGRKLSDYYPFLRNIPVGQVKISVFDVQKAAETCDIIFLAVPAGTAMRMAQDLLEAGVKVIDFSADFRLNNPQEYQDWYKNDHICPNLLEQAVYGLPEINAEKIKKTSLTANPGCYPTASILALYAALKHEIIDPENIIIDAKSGASGAGRKASLPNLFCEISDDFRAYGLPTHRHTPEIEQELAKITGKRNCITFTPHLVPMKRGILATIYTTLTKSLQVEQIRQIYENEWHSHPWIRILAENELPRTINVRESMYCDINLVLDKRSNHLIILSAIDNLCRGASGQALANANLMCGLEVDCGLNPLCPIV